MNPLRPDVLGVAFLLSLPMLALWWRGDFTADDVLGRLPWCLLAGWAAVAVLRFASAPRHPGGKKAAQGPAQHAEPETHFGEDHVPAN